MILELVQATSWNLKSIQYSQCEKAQSKQEEELSLDNVVQAPRLISA